MNSETNWHNVQVQSVLTALRVLEFVSESQPVGVSEVARALDIPKSSAQRSLMTLSTAGWIRRVEDGQSTRWSLTTRVLVIGNRVNGDLLTVARPAMELLHVQTNETIHLLVRDGSDLVLIEHLESPQILRSSYPLGTRMSMWATSSGKAYLAALSSEEVDAILSEGMTKHTPTTVTDSRQLKVQLEEVRSLGYATNRSEFTSGIYAVGAAIVGAEARPVAAFSVSVPASRMNDDRWSVYGIAVANAARSVSLALGYRPRSRDE